MIINSVTKYKGATYEVVIDGEKIYLHRDIVADFGLRPMTEISTEKYGEMLLASEMYQKGLDRELVDEVLSAYEDGTRERICEIIRKKYSGSLDDRDKVRKMKNALVRQGYSFDDINAAVKMMDCEDDDESYY